MGENIVESGLPPYLEVVEGLGRYSLIGCKDCEETAATVNGLDHSDDCRHDRGAS